MTNNWHQENEGLSRVRIHAHAQWPTTAHLLSQSAPRKPNQERKSHKPLRTPWISQRICQPCLSCYFDYRINKSLAAGSASLALSTWSWGTRCAKDRGFLKSYLPTNQRVRKIPSYGHWDWGTIKIDINCIYLNINCKANYLITARGWGQTHFQVRFEIPRLGISSVENAIFQVTCDNFFLS